MAETRDEMIQRWTTMDGTALRREWSAIHNRLMAKYHALTDEQRARIPVVG